MTVHVNRPFFHRQPAFIDKRSVLFSGKTGIKNLITYLKLKIQKSIFGSNPVMGIISFVFHALLFITPVFLSAHNIIADQFTGLSFFTLPDRLLDKFTLLIIAICVFFVIRRIYIPRVRLLTTISDYIVLILIIFPFFSAFAAYHQLFNYKISLYIHIITGEIAIMAVPFTKLGHMPFIIFSRLFVRGEYNSIYANRRW
jgi:nitrate reductase gamma subunit